MPLSPGYDYPAAPPPDLVILAGGSRAVRRERLQANVVSTGGMMRSNPRDDGAEIIPAAGREADGLRGA